MISLTIHLPGPWRPVTDQRMKTSLSVIDVCGGKSPISQKNKVQFAA